MTHIWVSDLPDIGSDNGLSPGRRQAIIWTNAGLLFIRTLGTNFSEILSEIFIQENVFENLVCEMASICLGLNMLINARPSTNTVVNEALVMFTSKFLRLSMIPHLFY